MVSIPVVSVIGWHNAGKTSFIVRLVRVLKARGLRVATLKHAAGGFQLDWEGTDTWRYARAGSDVVAIAGGERIALIEQHQHEPSLEELLARLPGDLDIVITEGYKRGPAPKIEVLAPGGGQARIAPPDQLLALVSADPPTDLLCDAPCFSPEDVAGVARLLESRGLIPGATRRL